MEADEVVEGELGVERGEGEVVEDFDVGAERVGKAHVFDEGDFFQHVARGVAPADAAADYGDRERLAVQEEEQHRHREEPIDGAGDADKLRARVALARKADGEEEEGVNFLALDLAGRLEEREGAAGREGRAADVVVGELEEELDFLPVVPADVGFIELALRVEVGAEARLFREVEGSRALVAECLPETAGGFSERLGGESAERGSMECFRSGAAGMSYSEKSVRPRSSSSTLGTVSWMVAGRVSTSRVT